MVFLNDSEVQFEAQYVEPTTDAVGGVLEDLSHTSVYYKVGNGSAVKSHNVPATSPSGGGNITTNVVVPVAVGQKVTVAFWITTTSLAGFEGGETERVELVVDRKVKVAPGVPTNFTVA